jgi:hypothetical protein
MAGQVGNCASDAAKTYWQRSNQFDRMMAERLTHPLYAMPPELADYLLRHLLRERAALDGFLRLGNEKSRAKRLDAWIACLAGPNAIYPADSADKLAKFMHAKSATTQRQPATASYLKNSTKPGTITRNPCPAHRATTAAIASATSLVCR